ncbi:MAG: hypothetical protein GEV28_10930 [Actinophytocola sp.]|uniref:alpha/beta hydrolase family protein n=1 Tax=Actinophytocola sp. TaxID=1872138 RepID=UPI00132224AD|nr:lipase [Actinophytocola sp.]MPZ80874.1 hypothetical protein [Actinophytocola sp.]
MRRTRVATAAVCAALMVVAPAVAVAAPAPVVAAQEQVAATKIASMSRAEVAAYLTGYELDAGAVRHGVDLYRMTYRTRGVDGRPTTATALVAVPRGAGPGRPTVAWLHGTRANRDDTGSMSDNLDRAAAVQFATAGHVTVAPDYLGLGEGPGTHPYMISKPTVTASLDALRAASGLARLDRRVLVTGFSQGGQASMLVARALQRDPHFRLGAVASISGPLDIRGAELPAALDGRLDGLSATLYLGYAMVAWNREYHLWDDPAEAFQAPYDQMMDTLFNSDTPEQDIVTSLPGSPEELFTTAFLAELRHPTGTLARVLRTNDDACRDWRPRVPVRLYTSTGDGDVAIANTLNCRDQLAESGVRASVVNLGDIDHVTAGRTAVPRVLAWFEQVD